MLSGDSSSEHIDLAHRQYRCGDVLLPLAGDLAQQFGLWILLPHVIVLTVVMIGLWLALRASAGRRIT